MRRYGIVHDVPGDGSCGYHCMMLLLRRMQLIDNTLSVTQFHRECLEFIESNMMKFVGDSPDGKDALFQYSWGQMDRQTKRSKTRCNPTAGRTRYITTNVINGIWSKHLDYSTPVSKAYWMDSAYSCPVIVIAYKYQIKKLVLYDNSGTDTNSVDGGLMCIVMTNPNVKYPLRQYLDLFTTLVPVEMRVWFSFVINHISI